MGNISRRSSGRGWKLRQRSMALWPQWIEQLNTKETPITLERPLIQLATSEKEALIMEELSKKRSALCVERLSPKELPYHNPSWPSTKYGGLISANDGRINPLSLLKCLRFGLNKKNVQQLHRSVIRIERNSSISKARWKIHLDNGSILTRNIIILCAAQASQLLLKDLGYDRQLETVLGQALDLELDIKDGEWSNWPAVLVSNGINLIPYKSNRLLLGATLELCQKPEPSQLKEIKNLKGFAPDWLKRMKIINQWYGLRCRPIKRYAPLLEKLEPGLILATAHYRNGILLSPATADWVANIIDLTEN